MQGAISSYLVPGSEPTLVDPGPVTSLHNLEAGLTRLGYQPADIRRICLTHVHLDHAGCVGEWVARRPGTEVVVHHEGAPHLANPAKLVASTRRTFGEAHDRLWGDVVPVPQDALRPWHPDEPGPAGLRVVPTPGHIQHHLSYLHESSGTLLAGDALGIVLAPHAPTHPATPPPSVQVDAWMDTLQRLAGLGLEAVGVAHFGIHGGPKDRVRQMRDALEALTERVRTAMRMDDPEDRRRFQEDTVSLQSGTRARAEVEKYFGAFSAASDWDGMRFWLERNDPEFTGPS